MDNHRLPFALPALPEELLQPLVAEWQAEHCWPLCQCAVVHLLRDVCQCLEMSEPSIVYLLGDRALAMLREWDEDTASLGDES